MAHTHLRIFPAAPFNSGKSKYPDLTPYEPSWDFGRALACSFDPSLRRKDLLGPNTAQRFYIEKGFISARYDDEPYLVPFLSPGSKKAVIVVPGGAYQDVSLDQEGYPSGEYFQAHGINCFVLKYRVYPYLYPTAALDCRRAICYVKAHAEEYGIDPNQVAMLGYSAGGNLAATCHYLFQDIPAFPGYVPDEVDAIDPSLSCLALIYPELSGERNLMALQFGEKILTDDSYYEQVKKDHNLLEGPKRIKTPVFLCCAYDDGVVEASNALNMANSCYKAGTRCELHLFREGGHGFGVSQEDFPPMFGIPARRMKGTREWANLFLNFFDLTVEERQ